MALNRREFLGALAVGSFASKVKASTADNDSWLFREQAKKGYSIMQGMTDESSAQFSLLLPRTVSWNFEVLRRDGAKVQLKYLTEMAERPYSTQAAHSLIVEGLELGVDYVLQVKDSGGRLQDEREFRALDLSPRKVRIGMLSCILDLLHRDDIWEHLEKRSPEIVMFLGDNVYADRTSMINKNPADEKQLWERYVLTRNRVRFYFQRRLIPVLATWDDHDFGADNAGATYRFKDESRVIFETFFAQAARPSLQSGPGIARKFSAFGADFFLLDGRSFRGVSDRMFGDGQEQWLLRNVAPRPAMLLNGSVFFGGNYSGESFEGSYPNDFKNFLKKLSGTQGLFSFVSGDVHFSEIMDIEATPLGYPTVELVTSSIHSFTFPGHEHRFRNPRRRVTTGNHNFLIFEAEFLEREMRGEVISYGANSEEFRGRISVRR